MRDFKKDEKFLYSLGNFGIKLGLEKMNSIMARMDNPNRNLRVVHIAGTNGKGSTLAFLERLFIASDFTVCSTTSPHLVKFNERFRYQGIDISDAELNKSYNNLLDALDLNYSQFEKLAERESMPTFFELSIALGFDFFRSKKPDFILLETGLGGRLDATNICDSFAHCITSISYDHTEFLGASIAEIASEKAGIIKNSAPVFLSKQLYAESYEAIENKCKETRSPLFSCRDLVKISATHSLTVLECEGFNPLTIDPKLLPLKGEHQIENLSLATLTYLNIIERNKQLEPEKFINAINSVSHRGRLESFAKNEKILIDAAHNEDGMRALVDYLNREYANKKLLIFISWIKSKKFTHIWQKELKFQPTFCPVQMNYHAGVDAEEIAGKLRKIGREVLEPINVESMIAMLEDNNSSEYDKFIVCGSLYFLGEFYEKYDAVG